MSEKIEDATLPRAAGRGDILGRMRETTSAARLVGLASENVHPGDYRVWKTRLRRTLIEAQTHFSAAHEWNDKDDAILDVMTDWLRDLAQRERPGSIGGEVA